MKLQEVLSALQPYVIGIRYVNNAPVVDAVFEENWVLPDSNVIKKAKGNDEINYYMIYSETAGIGIDELLEYVDSTIRVNIERQRKREFFKEKTEELKLIFNKSSLVKLKKLKFIFSEDDTEITDFHLDEIPEIKLPDKPDIKEEPVLEHQPVQEYQPMSPEDLEIEEEEKRAENYRKLKEIKKTTGVINKISNKVELPPKSIKTSEAECECGPEEACSKCIDRKGL